MRDDRERLADILRAIDKILDKTGPGETAFFGDEMLQVWVLHHLQLLGEAARSLSADFRRLHPDAVWSKAAGMRHVLVHHYFDIDASQIWKVVEHDLGPLRDRVVSILRSFRQEQETGSG
jgi:uncharacterized protein with HEPN domain